MREENEIEAVMNNDRVTVSFAAIINLKEPLDKKALNSAWFNVRRLNPFLRGRWENKVFVKFDHTDSDQLLEQGPEYRKSEDFKDDFQRVTNEFTFERLNELSFPSHLVVFGEGKRIQLTILIIHSLCDGKSMQKILTDLLLFYQHKNLNIYTGCETIDGRIEDVPKPISDLRQNLHNFPEKAKKYKKEFHDRLLNFQNVVPHEKFENIEKGRPQDLKSTMTLGCGTEEGAKKMKIFCKENGITVGSLLMAATAFINARIMRSIEKSKQLNFDVIFNLRPFLAANPVACYIFFSGTVPKVDASETLLEVAKRMIEEVKEKIDNSEHLMFPQFLHQLEDDGGTYKKIMDANNGVSNSISFSNIGQMNMETLNVTLPEITVDEVYCSGTRWNNVVEYTFLFQSTKKLCITITHFDLEVYRVAGELSKIDFFI
ncbi:Oidioi.mRNA.OKI2018_I69.PAR.g10606.t1.cds [Oikopleura dioica]|uniref:Oidioi.mRNA.OKI2018_I69.PAR.g10606.t1.cds n=1 Tax=Oikopleura dioica TaxID=34765 RepID=A0ABN7RVR9_OIKDI|nr:Oidioi.mRNA.OKI2018_I69.PAR.g10606.t1.cds [Oikopleura dioica]